MVLSLAVVVAAQVATADPAAPALERSIAESKRVRVTVARGAFVLTRPQAEEDGLHFQRVVGYPPPRPRLMDARRPPPPEPPTSPLPWSAIERVERPVRSYGPATPFGGVVGLLGGALFGVAVGYGAAAITDSAPVGYGVWGATALGGMYIGAKAAGQQEDWIPIYPEAP